MSTATTLQDLRDAIQVNHGQLAVEAHTLGSDPITALLAQFGQSGRLTIANARVVSTPDDAFVKVSGDTTLLNVQVSATARFYIDAEVAHLELLASPPDGWTLGQSFNSLKGSSLGKLVLGKPGLRLLSQTAGGAAAGLTLDGGFQLPPALEILQWFVAPSADARLSGPITLDAEGSPSMTLSVSPAINASLGGWVSLDVTLQHIVKTYARKPGSAASGPTATTLLEGHLGFTHNGTPVNVPLQASFGDKPTVLHLQLATADVFDLALSEIAHWVGGTNLVGEGLPSTYQPLGGLTLQEVDFAIGLQTQSLEHVSLTIASTQPWDLAKGLSIEGIVLAFMVMPKGQPRLSATLQGQLVLKNVAKTILALDIDAQVPDFLVRGHLDDDTVVDLVALIEYLGGSSSKLPATLQIDTLAFEANPGGSHYSFELDITGDWEITKGFSVEELKAGLTYDGQALDVLFEGRFLVAGVDLLVSAGYDSEAGGWKFAGDAARNNPILIGKLIGDLAADFSSSARQALPGYITSLELQNLGTTFDTATRNFTFHGETLFTIDNTPLDLAFSVTFTNADGGYTHTFSGKLQIGSLTFELVFESAKDGGEVPKTSSTFLAAVQPDFKIDVQDLVRHINADAGSLMPALTLDLENALFIYRKVDPAPATYLFGLALGLDLNLSSLPLVGSVFHDSNLGSIKDVQVLYTSGPVNADDVATFNTMLSGVDAKPALPTRKDTKGTTPVLTKGFNFAANIELGDQPIPVIAGGETAPAATPAPASAPAPVAPPSGNASWFDVKKSIGPVTLERVGVRYEDGRAWLLVDADFMLSSLTLGLQGLALGFKLDDLKDIHANLDGLSLDFESGALSIAGGFLHVGNDYIGEARVKAGTFGLTAIGGYAPGDKSFFIFARLTAPLGGPPYFFVTGLAGGFGVNRNLVVPPIDDLTQFALLPANNTFPVTLAGQSDPGQTLADTLRSTESYIPVMPGQNWAAAGIDFTSFEMVDSSALVTVAFGIEFSLALLGITRVTVPKLDPEPIVYLEITLEAQIKPSQGLIAVDGRLTPASFLYAKLCRITGGFAFYLWFSGQHEGDFVISIGGYHPRFTKPDHYPVVPRLQLSYQIGSLVIKGQSYLALTPHMVMAGLQIDAIWETGALKAWFSAGIDFLLGWKPFHYEADAYVHIGVSLTIDLLFCSVSITIHVGVDLNIWGPEFGGRADIDLDIVSFTIYFGADPRREAVDWTSFKTSFLPAGGDKAAAPPHMAHFAALAAAAAPGDGLLCTASITDGLVTDLKARDAGSFFSWIVDANHFALQSNTMIPAKQARFNSFDLVSPFTTDNGFSPAGGAPVPVYDTAAYPQGMSWATDFGVLPMQLPASRLTSQHVVVLKRAQEGADYTLPASYTEVINGVAVTPVLKPASAALWAGSDPGLNGQRLIDKTLAGLLITPMAQHPDITGKADLWAMLFDQNKSLSSTANPPPADTTDAYAASVSDGNLSFTLAGQELTCTDYKLKALTDARATRTRADIVASLNALGLSFADDAVRVDNLAAYPLWDWPMIRTLGEEISV
jgi:hypothetical protein